MGAGPGVIIQQPRHGNAMDVPVKIGDIAEELEGLGVAFADHVGGAVAVKDGNQLPGVPIRGVVAGIGGAVVVGHSVFNVCFVSQKLFIIGLVLVGGHDPLRLRHSLGHFAGSNGPGVNRVIGAARIGVCHVQGHRQGRTGAQGNLRRSVGSVLHPAAVPEVDVAALGLVVPVHFIGMIRHQGLDQRVGIQGHRCAEGFNGIRRNGPVLQYGIHLLPGSSREFFC